MFIESLENRSFLSATPVTEAAAVHAATATYATTTITKPQPPTNIKAVAGYKIVNGVRISTVTLSFTPTKQPAGSVTIAYYVNIVYNNATIGTIKIGPKSPVTIGGFRAGKNYFLKMTTVNQTGTHATATSVSAGVWVKTI